MVGFLDTFLFRSIDYVGHNMEISKNKKKTQPMKNISLIKTLNKEVNFQNILQTKIIFL